MAEGQEINDRNKGQDQCTTAKKAHSQNIYPHILKVVSTFVKG